jgi:Na+-driven multidrug efflux pump
MGGFALSIFLLSVGLTFNGSLDTLIPQAFGQKDLRLCRIYLNRQLYLTTFVFFVLAVPLIMIEDLLKNFYDPALATEAAIYVRICIPGVLFYCW